jgi:hypothetical protein
MPWQNDVHFELNPEQASQAPETSGILGLNKPEAWVYIGSANNIRQALLLYLNGNMPWISQQRPVHFTYELVDLAVRTLRCCELTREYRPIFLKCV